MKNYITTFLLFSLTLTGCATTSAGSSIEMRSNELHKGRAFPYVFSDMCFKQGYYDSDYTAKIQHMFDVMTEANKRYYDLNLIESYKADLKTELDAAIQHDSPAKIKEACDDMKVEFSKMYLQYDDFMKEKQNRPVVINQTPSYKPRTPSFTNCTNLGSMVSCAHF